MWEQNVNKRETSALQRGQSALERLSHSDRPRARGNKLSLGAVTPKPKNGGEFSPSAH